MPVPAASATKLRPAGRGQRRVQLGGTQRRQVAGEHRAVPGEAGHLVGAEPHGRVEVGAGPVRHHPGAQPADRRGHRRIVGDHQQLGHRRRRPAPPPTVSRTMASASSACRAAGTAPRSRLFAALSRLTGITAVQSAIHAPKSASDRRADPCLVLRGREQA